MAENIIGQGLTTLYRGQPMFGPSRYLKRTNQGLNAPGTGMGLNKKDLSKLAGQYYTTNPNLAGSYAGPFGKIKSMTVPSNYLNKFNRFQKSVVNLPGGKFNSAGAGGGGAYLVPKSTINTFKPSINYGQTIKNIADFNNPFKTLIDEAKIIKAGYDIGQYGPGGVLKEVGSKGLGFLKQNAFRTLAMLGTLPAQAGVMTLSPTRMGNAELRQMPKGPPSIINQGGGNGGGGVKDSGGSTGGYSYDSGGRQGFGYGLAMGGFI